MDAIMTEGQLDGRTARARRTQTTVLEACRRLMCAGDFRPTVVAVAIAAGCSVRSVFQHFTDLEGVHRAALDVRTRDAIAKLIMPAAALMPSTLDADCISFAAVFGRPLGKEAANG